MVPAPMMPTRLTDFASVPAAIPSILAAARSAKNWCRSALDCGSAMQASKACLSIFSPSSKGAVPAAFRQSRIRWGAVCPLRRLAIVSRAPESSAMSSSLNCRGMSLVRRLPAPRLSSSAAKSVAACARSPPLTSSTMPATCASLALSGRPLVIISIAVLRPVSRGSRWVPPAPGSRPKLTSGNPTLAVSTTRR